MGNRQCKKSILKQDSEANCKGLAEVKKLTTWLDEEEISFIWEIKNFEHFRATKEIKSPTFRFKNGEEWMIVIEKGKGLNKDYRYLSVRREASQWAVIYQKWVDCARKTGKDVKKYVSAQYMTAEENLPRYKVQILGSESRGVIAEFKNKNDRIYYSYYYSRPIKESLLFKSYLTDGHLKISCQLFLPGEIRHQAKVKGEVNPFVGIERHLAIMKHMLATGTDADVEIVTGTKSFPAHKIILKRHSSVFLKMFETEILKTSTNSILNMEDFGEEAVGAMLSYIYTGTTDNITQNALQLLKLSEKYAIDGLKEDAQSALIQNLSLMSSMHLG